MDKNTAHTNKLKLTWGIICLVGPAILIVVTILLYAIVNFVFGSLIDSDAILTRIINVLLYLVGVVGVLSLVPGIVVGIVLLAIRK